MGLFGGSKRPKPPPLPTLGPMGSEFQGEIYPIIQRGLRGEGMFPNLNAQAMRDLLGTTRESFLETQRDTPGMLARFVPRADTRVRDFVRSSIDSDYYRQVQGIKDEFATVKEDDRQLARALGFNALSAEKRMGVDLVSMYNQSLSRRASAPTYQSALLGGLGSAAGWGVGSMAQGSAPSVFTNQNTRFGAGFDNPAYGGSTGNFPASAWNTPAPVNFARGFNATP